VKNVSVWLVLEQQVTANVSVWLVLEQQVTANGAPTFCLKSTIGIVQFTRQNKSQLCTVLFCVTMQNCFSKLYIAASTINSEFKLQYQLG
jgi:hypothetical protein